MHFLVCPKGGSRVSRVKVEVNFDIIRSLLTYSVCAFLLKKCFPVLRLNQQMSIVNNISSTIKVFDSKSQAAPAIDFSIKCVFCLLPSIILAIFTHRCQPSVFVSKRCFTWIGDSCELISSFLVSCILALMDPLKHAAAFTGSAWAQTQAKLLPDEDVCQHQGFTSELVCFWQMETWLWPFSSFWFNWESFHLFCGMIMEGFEVHIGKSLWRLETTVLNWM